MTEEKTDVEPAKVEAKTDTLEYGCVTDLSKLQAETAEAVFETQTPKSGSDKSGKKE